MVDPQRTPRPQSAELRWPSIRDQRCPCCMALWGILRDWKPVIEEHMRKVRELDEHVRVEGTIRVRGTLVADSTPANDQVLTYDSTTDTYGPETP